MQEHRRYVQRTLLGVWLDLNRFALNLQSQVVGLRSPTQTLLGASTWT